MRVPPGLMAESNQFAPETITLEPRQGVIFRRP
jgi:hypothetical protein